MSEQVSRSRASKKQDNASSQDRRDGKTSHSDAEPATEADCCLSPTPSSDMHPHCSLVLDLVAKPVSMCQKVEALLDSTNVSEPVTVILCRHLHVASKNRQETQKQQTMPMCATASCPRVRQYIFLVAVWSGLSGLLSLAGVSGHELYIPMVSSSLCPYLFLP